MDQFSYSLGVVLAQNLTNQGISDFNSADLVIGLEDVVKNNSLKVSTQEADQIIQKHLKERIAFERAKQNYRNNKKKQNCP